MDFGNVAPTNEHDGQTFKGITDLMKAVLKRKLKGMKRRWIEECEMASKVDPEVPVVRKRGRTWILYP